MAGFVESTCSKIHSDLGTNIQRQKSWKENRLYPIRLRRWLNEVTSLSFTTHTENEFMNSILGINVDMSAEAELVDAGRFHSEDTGR